MWDALTTFTCPTAQPLGVNYNHMNTAFKLVSNLILGAILFFFVFAAAFSGNLYVFALMIAFMAVIGILLSYHCSKNSNLYYWLYAVAYISAPSFFLASSCNNSPDCTATYVSSWGGIILFVLATSSIGGLYGAK